MIRSLVLVAVVTTVIWVRAAHAVRSDSDSRPRR